MVKKKGLYIAVEGVNGAGKGTVSQFLARFLRKKKLKVFDLDAYLKKKRTYPPQIKEQVIFCSEPTFSPKGKKIRRTKFKTALQSAKAFAADRNELLTKIINPAIGQGKIVISQRCIMSSFVYQVIQASKENKKEYPFVKKLKTLNKLALKTMPDYIFVLNVNPVQANKRLKRRTKKDVFYSDNPDDEYIANIMYHSKHLKEFLAKKKSKIVYIETNPPNCKKCVDRLVRLKFQKFLK